MLNRTLVLKLFLKFIHYLFDPIRRLVMNIDKKTLMYINKINEQEFVFFTKGDSIATLNKVMLYITKNEHTKRLKIVHILEKDNSLPKNLAAEIDLLDREYPSIKIEFVVEKGEFTPEMIQNLSEKWKIPINFMFIGSPSDKFNYKVEDLGGVRLII